MVFNKTHLAKVAALLIILCATEVFAQADLAITKTVSNSRPSVGTDVTFTLTLVNNGPSNATGIIVSDPIPAGMTFQSSTPSQGTYTPASGIWNVGNLNNGATATLAIVASVDNADPKTNQATITASSPADPNPGNNSSAVLIVPNTGDGYRPIIYNGRIYVVNHHAEFPLRYLVCFDVSLGQVCPGYPAAVPITSGQAFTTSGDTGVRTVGKTIEYLDRATGRLYFPVQRLSNGDVGFLCANLNTNTSCGFTVLEAGVALDTGNFSAMLQGMEEGNGKFYAAARTGQLYCMTIATQTPCTGQPFNSGVARTYTSSSGSDDLYATVSIKLSNRLYTNWPVTGGATSDVSCFDTATDSACAGWPQNINLNPAIFYPVLNSAGTPTGLCLQNTTSTCRNLDGSNLVPPASFTTFMASNEPTYANFGFHDAGVFQTRVFSGADVGGTITNYACYDWSNLPSGACTGTFPISFANQDRVYAIVADPDRAGCMWAYGDDARLRVWNALTGGACGTTADLSVTKIGPASLPLGSALSYTITVTNNGPSNITGAPGATITDNVPANISAVTWTCTTTGTATCGLASGSGNVINFSGNTINAGAGNSIVITVNGTAAVGGSIINTVTVSPPPGTIDPDVSNNQSSLPTTITATQTIDVVKQLGPTAVLQVGPATFDVPYTIRVGNRDTVTATNVQVVDNLIRTFGTVPTIAVTAYSITPVAPATGANCIGPTTAFNGTTQQTLLRGDTNLPANGACVIAFTVRLNYGVNPVPTLPQNNHAYASVANAANPGASVPNNPAQAPTYPAGTIATDISTDGPTLPATPNADTPTPTPVTLPQPQVIDVVKSVGPGSVTQVGASAWTVPYTIIVGNTSPTVTASNVQAVDNLRRTYGTVPTLMVSAYSISAIAPATAGQCVAPVTAYDGTTNQQLLRGDTNLPPSGACRITFTVRVDYGVNPVPLGPQLNSVYASTASAANNGATVPDDPAQAPTYPANTITNDVSTDGPSLPLTPNGDTASPTPVTFAALGPALIPSLQQWLLWLLTLLLLSLGAWHLRREA